MTFHKELLNFFLSFPSPKKIRAANKETFDALGVSQMVVTTKVKGKPVEITLKDTLYVPQITFTLISIGRCDNAGYHAEFVHNKCIIKTSKGRILLQAPKLHGLYRIDHEPAYGHAYISLSAYDIHKKLRHNSEKALKYLFKHGMISGLELEPSDGKFDFKACNKPEITHKPLPKEPREHTKKPGDRVYSDVWGPARHATLNKQL